MHLPIGVSNFRKLVEYKDPAGIGYLYVDKTSFIKEIIYDLTEVIVLTRPRRFGKTLNLSMLQQFFADMVDGQPTSGLFDGLKISKHSDCMQCQGKHPVIFLSLKDTKADSFESTINKIYEQIRQIYEQHRYVIEDNKISKEEKDAFTTILNKTASIDVLSFSLYNLSYYIHKTLGQKVYILIDEYDTPIQAAYLNEYYDKFISFMKGLLGSALKGNSNLRQAVLTGILRISKESLFSELNNVEIYSIFSEKYAKNFGFTEEEVNSLLVKTELPTITKQAKDWYNGYNFGGITMYNPWSIIKFIAEKGKLRPYWVNTSGNDLIKQLIIKAAPVEKNKISSLIAGNSIREIIDEHMVFSDLNTNPSSLWNLFLMSGYLKASLIDETVDGEECDLSIPNKEIGSLYRRIVREWLSGARGLDWYRAFLDDLANGKAEAFEEKLQTLINDTLSSRDVTKASQECFYHGLMLAFVSGLKETHYVKSNKESGKGFYDVAIIPKDIKKIGVVMEFKAITNEDRLDPEAKKALQQINKSNYISELKQQGIVNICKMGIAFAGKNVRVLSQ